MKCFLNYPKLNFLIPQALSLLIATAFLTFSYSSKAQCFADFNYSVVQGAQVQFTNTSSTCNQTSWTWSFGDGNTSNQMNPLHTYTMSGIYYVCLTLSAPLCNCQATFCDTIYINSSGGCSAFYTYSQAGSTINFFDQSTAGSNYFTQWLFGDGNYSNAQNPVHTYSSGGIYYVCLTVYDSSGCQSTYCEYVTIPGTGGGCNASFTYGQQNQYVFFNNTSSDSCNSASYYWDFGDGSTSTQVNPSHQYNSNGLFVVCLSLIDSICNCFDTTCDTVQVGTANNCNAFFTYFTNGLEATFSNQSTSSSSSYTLLWNFGDGISSTQTNPVHNYALTGDYYVCLTIADANNCTDTYCQTVHVDTCNIQQTFTYVVQGDTVYFDGSSADSCNLGVEYVWNFGDNTVSYDEDPIHVYNGTGPYIVTLIVWDSCGCIGTIQDSVSLFVQGIYSTTENQIRVYPNPADDYVLIETNGNQVTSLELFDSQGRKVESVQEESDSVIRLELSQLNPGMYLLMIHQGGKIIFQKLSVFK